jgi:hypothetical protein
MNEPNPTLVGVPDKILLVASKLRPVGKSPEYSNLTFPGSVVPSDTA